ncbi:MAG: hypothetical protein ABSD21_12775 [Rhizomicrobium sp.]
MDTEISTARQNGVNDAFVKRVAASAAKPVAVHPRSDVFDAHRAFGPVAFQEQLKYLPDGCGLSFFNLQAFLDCLAALFGFDCAIAERRLRTVPETLTGIFEHRARDVFGSFRAVQCVRCCNDGFGKISRRAHAKILRHGNKRDAVLLDLTFVNEIASRIAEEPGLAVNQDHVERRRVYTGRVHHSLELRTLVVTGARARINKFPHHDPFAFLAVPPRLGQLVGNRNVVLGLPRGRHPCIDGNPFGHLDGSSLSLAGTPAQSSNRNAMTSISTCMIGESLGIVTIARIPPEQASLSFAGF